MKKLPKKTLLALALYFLSLICLEARLFLQVTAIHRKGIDKNLTLTNELHVEEEVIGERPIKIVMKNGILIELIARYESRSFNYGPSSRVQINGRVLANDGRLLEDINNKSLFVELGSREKIILDKGNQKIELNIAPINR